MHVAATSNFLITVGLFLAAIYLVFGLMVFVACLLCDNSIKKSLYNGAHWPTYVLNPLAGDE